MELMRQRRDAWRARYTEEHARYLFEHEKVKRLEREMVIAEANKESLEILRREVRRLRAVIADQHSELSWELDQKDTT